MLDPAPARSLGKSILQNVTWFTPNEIEAAFYAPAAADTENSAQAAQVLLESGCGGIVLKMGARGAYMTSTSISGSDVTSFPVNAVDTTAAGDAFNGAFATALMLGKPPLESATFAAAAAALSVTRPGAQASMATRDEVEAFLTLHTSPSAHP
jgi:ribokinase